MLCVRNFFVLGVISEETFEQMAVGKADIRGQQTGGNPRMSRIKSVKLDRTSINEDEILAFNEPSGQNNSPTYGNYEDQDYFSGSRMHETEEDPADDDLDPFALKE